MWIFKYLVCLVHKHIFIDITWQGSPYQYCLRCGQIELQDTVKETIIVGGGRW